MTELNKRVGSSARSCISYRDFCSLFDGRDVGGSLSPSKEACKNRLKTAQASFGHILPSPCGRNAESPMCELPFPERDSVSLMRTLPARSSHIGTTCDCMNTSNAAMESALPAVLSPRSDRPKSITDATPRRWTLNPTHAPLSVRPDGQRTHADERARLYDSIFPREGDVPDRFVPQSRSNRAPMQDEVTLRKHVNAEEEEISTYCQ